MIIDTVKIQGNGYLVNGMMTVPKVEGNRHYQIIQEWIAEGNTPEPEFTLQELEVKQQTEFRAERDRLLAATDFRMTVDYFGSMLQARQDEITEYRQALRDATNDWVLPEKPVWL